MAKTGIVIYQEKEGQVPLLDWLDNLPRKVQDKCVARVELLAEYGLTKEAICKAVHEVLTLK